MMKVLIADDHAFTLEGMQHVLQASGFIEVCAAVSEGMSAVLQARAHQPDIALLDYALPDGTGLEVLAEIRRWSPATRGIIVTGNARPEVLARILAMGVPGLCTKGCPADAVIAAIRIVAAGGRFVSDLAQGLIDSARADPLPALTPRELECLQWAAEGKTSWEIGRLLRISERTAIFHLNNASRKLGVCSRQAAVARAVALRMLSIR